MIGYIYFVQSESGLVKIGKTHLIDPRIENLCYMNGSKVHVVGLLELNIENEDQLTLKEIEIHDKFTKYRRRGEWFKFTKDIAEFITIYCNKDCQEINDMLWKLYHTPTEFKNDRIENGHLKYKCRTQSNHEIIFKIVERYVSDHPGDTTTFIAKSINRTRSSTYWALNELVKLRRITKVKTMSKKTRHVKCYWYPFHQI
jgi:hypothetical protein